MVKTQYVFTCDHTSNCTETLILTKPKALHGVARMRHTRKEFSDAGWVMVDNNSYTCPQHTPTKTARSLTQALDTTRAEYIRKREELAAIRDTMEKLRLEIRADERRVRLTIEGSAFYELCKEHGVIDNTKAKQAWDIAYADRHSEGVEAVKQRFAELVELIK